MKIFILLSCLAMVALCSSDTCGGTFRGFQYAISSPNYPRNYSDRLDCVYMLRADTTADCDQEFHLQFQDFNVRDSTNCREDYLLVGDRNVYCGSVSGLRKFKGKNNTLKVVFHTDDNDVAKGFKILVTALPCAWKLNPLKNTVNNVEIASHSYDNKRKTDDNASLSTRFTFPLEADNYSGNVQSLGSTKDPSIPHVTSYLFLPPSERNSSVFKPIDNVGTNAIPNDLVPPSTNRLNIFKPTVRLPQNAIPATTWDKSSSVSQGKKFVQIPVRSNGETGVGVVDYDIQVASDCDKGASQPDEFLRPSADTNYDNNRQGYIGGASGLSSSLLYDPREGLINTNSYQSAGYQQPNNFGSNYQNPNLYQQIPDSNYQSAYYPGNTNEYPIGYPGNAFNPSPYPNNGLNNGWNNGWSNGYNNPTEECCRLQTGRRFLITSPGFPGSNAGSTSYSCRYTITKSSPDVCRLRLNFRFFNFGAEDPYCNYGFLEIDGRRYCGCKSGQTDQIIFTNSFVKSIVVSNAGYPRSTFNGFLIDVIQESCGGSSGGYPPSPYYSDNTPYTPSGAPCTSQPTYPSNPSYPIYPSQPTNPCYPTNPSYPTYPQTPSYPTYPQTPSYPTYPSYPSYPSNPSYPTYPSGPSYPCNSQQPSLPYDPNGSNHPDYYQRRQATLNSTELKLRNKRNAGYSYQKPSIPFDDKIVDAPSVGGQSNARFFGSSCQNRLLVDWVVASKEVLLRNGRCERFGPYRSNARSDDGDLSNEDLPACEEINAAQGVISSPLYPNNYPSNVRKCYRFVKTSDFCKVEIHMNNFDLESSQDCSKDYLLFGRDGKKYCGASLKNYKTIFDLTPTNSLEVYFTSDSQETGKGFNMSFSQQLCQESTSS